MNYLSILFGSLSCDLHLDSPYEADAAFLESDTSTKLFVWVAANDGSIQSSQEALDPVNLGALCFIKTAPERLQCMTIAPRVYQEEGAEEGAEGTEESKSAPESTSTLDALQLYTRHCFGPAVRALSGQPTSEETEGKSKSVKLLEGLEDKIRELDVALGQCRRSALSQIPSIHLAVDPVIAKAAEKATSDKIALTSLEDLDLASKLSEDDFLNNIQAGVTQWIVQIRKVTVLPSSTAFPSVESNTAADLEEVSFWLQLEIALQQIPQELARPEVELTLNVLKAAKRFLATIALDNNTGLEGALSQTQDICHFLRNYPAPALEAARDWDKISSAMNSIFDHFPKIRSSRYYDLERVVKLLEATTLTLRRRMISVLEHTAFLFMEYPQYETQVRFPTQDVLVQFDDRYEEFSEFFNELARRRKVSKPSSILKNITLYHKALQERLEILHDFRAGHEKLRTVLKEVLDVSDPTIKEMEALPRKLFSSLDVLDLAPNGTSALERALEEYDRDIDGIEGRLARLLREKLQAAKDAEEVSATIHTVEHERRSTLCSFDANFLYSHWLSIRF